MTAPRDCESVLVVEDDLGMASLFRKLVIEMGYRPVVVTTGEDAMHLVKHLRPTAIVLDLLLPGIDGLEVTRDLRTVGICSAILMVTVLAEPGDQVAGFQAGVDDYLTKPFDVEVFKARLACAIRHRPAWHRPSRLEFSGIALDLLTRQAWFHTRHVALSPVEFGILHALLETPGHLVSVADLAARAWGDSEVRNSNAYHVAVSRLRKRLQALSGTCTIEAVRGQGYLLCASLPARPEWEGTGNS